jgi:hypothetical protein
MGCRLGSHPCVGVTANDDRAGRVEVSAAVNSSVPRGSRVACWPQGLAFILSVSVLALLYTMSSKKEKPIHSLIAGATAGAIEA